ncbi:OmpA family protein [uncultured Photobacterium sp.]|uniref:OmpA family protein n=1 Tax=uncultured Photobacterium sp. TaxID=173973 RepID=UPI00260B4143|nr:OmpA family protein [uncultured Photobacterium sp.]
MKYIILLATGLLVSGCSSTIDSYPTKIHQLDLMDKDQDGVINTRDHCQQTQTLDVINNNGCGAKIINTKNYNLHILFANDSIEITPIFSNEINFMAEFMKDYPSTKVIINGYASPVGHRDYNQALSLRRSNAVRNMLISHEIAPSRITIKGFGDTNPIFIESEESNRLSRRVTASLIGKRLEYLKQWDVRKKHMQL